MDRNLRSGERSDGVRNGSLAKVVKTFVDYADAPKLLLNSSSPLGTRPPWREKKGSIFEGGVRVPGIMEWPAVIQQPRSTNTP